MDSHFESIDIKVRIYPTEIEERLRTSVLNIFPDAILEVEKGEPFDTLYGKSSDLETIVEKIRNQKIRATARKVLLRSIDGHILQFNMNKQVALVGKLNFSDGNSVLGDILIKMVSEEPEALVDILTSFEKKEEEE